MSYRVKKAFVLFFLIFLVSLGFSGDGIWAAVKGAGTVKGTATNLSTGKPLKGVKIRMAGGKSTAYSDSKGRYVLNNVLKGKRFLGASLNGFSSLTRPATVRAGATVILNFPLRPIPKGRVLYVSPTGSDANPGTKARPWASPGFASRNLHPGDTLIILGGRYVLSRYDEDIITPASGKSGGWITIKGESGKKPLLAGRDNLFSAIDLAGKSYVRVENLEISHDPTVSGENAYFRGGVAISGRPSSHIVLKDLYIHQIDEGAIDAQDVNDLQILNCRLEYCGFGGIGGPAATAGGLRNLKVYGCTLSYSGHYYRGEQGSSGPYGPYDRPDGFGIEPSSGPVEIKDTVSEHNYGDGLDSKADNTYIHNCVVANNSCDGIKLWGTGSKIVNSLVHGTGDGVGGSSPWAGVVIGTDKRGSRFEMVNVTVHDNPSRQAYPMYVQYGDKTPISLVMRNNIIANGFGAVYVEDSVSLTADHNLFYRPGDAVQVEARGRSYTTAQLDQLGQGNIFGNPKFAKPAWGTRGDYRLQAGSPAIDKGTSNGAPTTDISYTRRPQGRGFDIGAYERVAGTSGSYPYDIGSPKLEDIWVDPSRGNDSNAGSSRGRAVKTIAEAWSRIPSGRNLSTTGFRILLVSGSYGLDDLPPSGWFDSKHGTYQTPVIIEAADGANTAKLPAMTFNNCSYIYMKGLAVEASGDDVMHLSSCNHILIKRCRLTGTGSLATYNCPQETLKANQCRYVYVESSDISGAWGNALDFVAVQYGHIVGNRLHRSGDWAIYLKGGSAYFTIEGNEIFDGGTGGFTAGQGSGFEWMVSPWIHYEASDIKFINNLIHDTEGAGMGVNGGHNILLAYNTLYRVGRRSHALEFVHGIRGCDGNASKCLSYLRAGGWGTAIVGDENQQPIPNRNLYVFNNIVLNPLGFSSAWSQFAIADPATPAANSNIPSPSMADDNLVIKGNVIMNGLSDLPLGVNNPANPTCNELQLKRDNSINEVSPQLTDPSRGDFRPVSGGNVFSAKTFAIPDFLGSDRPLAPAEPAGDRSNLVTRDFNGNDRSSTSPPGALVR